MKLFIQIPVNRCTPKLRPKSDIPSVYGILFFMSKYTKDYVPEGSLLTFIELTQKEIHIIGQKRIFQRAKYICSCGREVELLTGNVKSGKTKSCGCFWGRWTDAQDKILLDNFPDISKVAILSGKTISSVKCRSRLLKLYHAPVINFWYESVPVEIRAYLAGHFDGEGCAAFRKRKTVRAPILMVSIAHFKTLELYVKHFGGSLDDHNSTRPATLKKLYRWRCVTYENIYNFILAVLPFSMEKKSQLLCLKRYIDEYIKNGKKIGFDDDFMKLSHELHQECTNLKKDDIYYTNSSLEK